MYVHRLGGADDDRAQHQQSDLETLEGSHRPRRGLSRALVLDARTSIDWSSLVWLSPESSIDARLGRAGIRATSCRKGCRERCACPRSRSSAAALIGVVFGTLITIKFLALQALIGSISRSSAACRSSSRCSSSTSGFRRLPGLEFAPLTCAAIALVLWGSRRSAEATVAPFESIRRSSTRPLRRSASAGLPPLSVILPQALRRRCRLRQRARGPRPELHACAGDRRPRGPGCRVAPERAPDFDPPIGLGEIDAFEIFGG